MIQCCFKFNEFYVEEHFRKQLIYDSKIEFVLNKVIHFLDKNANFKLSSIKHIPYKKYQF